MRCSICKKGLDHNLSYEFLVDGRTVIMCDKCRENYLMEQAELARPKRKKK